MLNVSSMLIMWRNHLWQCWNLPEGRRCVRMRCNNLASMWDQYSESIISLEYVIYQDCGLIHEVCFIPCWKLLFIKCWVRNHWPICFCFFINTMVFIKSVEWSCLTARLVPKNPRGNVFPEIFTVAPLSYLRFRYPSTRHKGVSELDSWLQGVRRSLQT